MHHVASIGTPALWIGFTLFVLAMLALDLGVFHRKAHEVHVQARRSIWSARLGRARAGLQRRRLLLVRRGAARSSS